MRNEILTDSKGNLDYMVVFTPQELGLPDEIKGRKVKEYLISKYTNSVVEGTAYSLPNMQPRTGISFDGAVQFCESKGAGWHLMTNDEWAAIALWCWKNGTMPRGNTCRGKSYGYATEHGETYDGFRTLTGSGPETWYHDHTLDGIADLVGNVCEWVGGLRFLDGVPQIIPDNGAAAGADQSEASDEWTDITDSEGRPLYYNVLDDEIRVQTEELEDYDWDGVPFSQLTHDPDTEIPEELIRLGLYPPEGYTGDEFFYLDNDGERMVFRGGAWAAGARAGVFCVNGAGARSDSHTGVGFRSALIRYSDTSDNLED